MKNSFIARGLSCLLVIVLCLGTALPVFARDDLQYWNEFQLKKKLSDEFSLSIKHDMRLIEDWQKIGLVNVDLGIDWKQSKYLTLGPHFTYEHDNKTSGRDVNENRWYPEVTLKYPWKQWTVSSRNRMEYRNKNTTDSWRYRNLFKLNYALPFEKFKAGLFVGDELFWEISDSSFNQNRFRAGTSLELRKNVQLSLYYLLKSVRNDSDWIESHVFATGLTLSI